MQLASILALATIVSSPSSAADGAPIHPDTGSPRNVPLEGRKSPLDSLTFTVGKQPVKVCYGRPSSRHGGQ